MVSFLRRLIVLVLGIALLVAPTLVRDELWQYDARPYVPPEVPELALAATPVPTGVPTPLQEAAYSRTRELRAGPVVLDLAHYNSINPSSLQPLADALAGRGLGLRYWLSTIDVMAVTNYLDYPDQSEALADQLADASALIVISPFFLWSNQEIALVEQFVADGGRLLLVSDPDIMGDYAAATNMIGEPFGVVFNEDYLYDTTVNDGNFTFFFQETTQADAENNAVGDTVESDTADNTLSDVANDITGDTTDDTTGDTATSEPTLAPDATIAFYGGRSLSGDLRAVLHSVDTTLSSLRIGKRGFVTAGVGGVRERGTDGRVLALSDLDVLTEPYRQRYDNQALVDYVAGFLSADRRINRVVDFPDYLGKEVTLAFGASAAINADLIMQGAQIQQVLETSGRTLTLRDAAPLGINSSSTETRDLIYLADYTTAISQTTLLDDLGIELYREVVTKTVEITPEPTKAPSATPVPSADAESEATPTKEQEGEATDGEEVPTLPTLTPTPPITATRPITAATAITVALGVTAPTAVTGTTTQLSGTNIAAQAPVTSTSPVDSPAPLSASSAVTGSTALTETSTAQPTPTVEVRTIITTYLHLDSGLTFLADETVLIIHTTQNNQMDEDESDGSGTGTAGANVLAVLAANNRGIDNGVNRLLENDFSGCVVGDLLTFCALEGSGGEGSGGSSSTTSSDSGAGNSDSTGSDSDGTPTDPEKPTPPRGTDAPLLLIDDNRAASADELSEADSYLQHLVAAGYQVDLWSVTDQGVPAVDDLTAYGWVIWSNGGYAAGAIGGRDLDTIFSYINANGRITISSRAPLPGLEEMAPISDIVVDSAIPALVADLPEAPIALVDAGSAAVLNAMAEEDDATQVVMRRGPASENADAPALVVLADPSSAESEARLMIVALSMTWLPDEEQTALIDNMATWMLTP